MKNTVEEHNGVVSLNVVKILLLFFTNLCSLENINVQTAFAN